MQPLPNQKIAVWFSCGAASAMAAYYTLKKYRDTNQVHVVNNPVIEEDPDNLRFLQDVQDWLKIEIETAKHHKFPNASAEEVWDWKQYMVGVAGAPCTKYLKRFARQQWENEHKPDWHVLGFTVDEQKRHDRFVLTERNNVLPVLIEEGLTKQDCLVELANHGIEIPDMYKRGYPNANCVGCVKSQSPTYWNHVRKDRPEVFQRRAEQSRKIGAKLVKVKGKRIFLDELPEDAVGRPMKNLSIECGIFCEEPTDE